jgi:hypothetical protein
LPTAFANASRKRQVELPNLHARNTGDDSGWHLELPTSALTDCCPGLLRGMSVSGQLDEKRLLGEVAWLEFRFELHVGLLPGRFRYKLPRNCVGKIDRR